MNEAVEGVKILQLIKDIITFKWLMPVKTAANYVSGPLGGAAIGVCEKTLEETDKRLIQMNTIADYAENSYLNETKARFKNKQKRQFPEDGNSTISNN